MSAAFRSRLLGGDGHKYALIGGSRRSIQQDDLWRRKHSVLVIMLIAFAGLVGVFVWGYVCMHRAGEQCGFAKGVVGPLGQRRVIRLRMGSNVILRSRITGVSHRSLRTSRRSMF